jgi:alpha-galactosidase
MGAVEAGIVTNDDAENRFRRYIESVREGIGPEAFLLVCWGVLSQAVGVCDACRIAGDANTTWGSFRMQIYETARWFHTQRILFQADPDHICARSHPVWTKSLLSLVSLTGGLFMLSDDVDTYDGERLDMIRRTIPAQPVTTAETGPVRLDKPAFAYTPGARKTGGDLTVKEALQVSAVNMDDLQEHGFGNLWSVHYLVGERRWCVTGRFALVPLEESDLHLSALGLDPQRRYHAFDFWAEEYLGCVRGVLHCPTLGLGECQVIGFVAESDRPAYVADNRHISMGLHFLTSETWDGNTLGLGVRGVRGKEFSCWIAIPDGYESRGLGGTGAKARWVDRRSTASVRALRVAFQADEGYLQIVFARSN